KKMDHFEHLIQSHSLKDPAKGLTVDNINTDLAWIAKDAKGQFAGIKNHAILTANPQCQAIITKLRDMGKISEKEFKKFMEKLDKINRLAGMNKQLQEKDDLAADPDKPADPDKSAVTQKQQAGIIAGGENKDQPIPAEQASGIISGAVKDKEGLEEKIEIANTSSSPEPTPSPSPDPSIVTTDEGSSSESETDLQSPLSGNESDKDNNDDVTPSSFKPGGR
ncbi:MAG TPA: hypothetical protein VHA13_03315, partial [Gammaproteobacteria bacterium]|nr:hypothetical protein [Gammaproteobacteria bacterium]